MPFFSKAKNSGFILVALFLVIFLLSFFTANWKYETFRSNWARDLGSNNNKFWNLASGHKYFTLVAPQNIDGPEVWRVDHFSAIRLLFIPLYSLFPNIRTLFFGQSLIIYLGIFAMYALGAQLSKSRKIGLFCAFSYALAPAVFNLSINDFRPLQLSLPLLLFTFYFYRMRYLGRFLLFGTLTLAVRGELIIAMVLLGLLGAFKKESLFLKLRWFLYILLMSFGWFILLILFRMHFHGLDTGIFSDIFCFKSVLIHTESHLSNFKFTSLGLFEGLNAGFMYFLRYTLYVFLLAFLSPWPLIVVSPVVFYLCGILKDEMVAMSPFSHVQHYTAIIVAFIFIAFVLTTYKFRQRVNTNAGKLKYLFRFNKIFPMLHNQLLVFLIILMAGAFCVNFYSILKQLPYFNSTEQIKLHKFEKVLKKEEVILASNQLLAFFSSRKGIYFYENSHPFISWEEILQKIDYAVIEKRHQRMVEELMSGGQFRVIDNTEKLTFLKKTF